jgi:TPR repeat protein
VRFVVLHLLADSKLPLTSISLLRLVSPTTSQIPKGRRRQARHSQGDRNIRAGRRTRPRHCHECARRHICASRLSCIHTQPLPLSEIGPSHHSILATRYVRRVLSCLHTRHSTLPRKCPSRHATRALFLSRHQDNGHGGINKDFGLALYWFQLAAESGCVPAIKNLGIVYEYGRAGVLPKDELKAFEYYKAAAEKDNEPAKEAVRRLEVNLRPMHELEAKADELRDPEQQFQIGRRYHNGLNCPQNVARAIEWYERAVNLGHAGAANNLGAWAEEGNSSMENIDHLNLLYYLDAHKGVFGSSTVSAILFTYFSAPFLCAYR